MEKKKISGYSKSKKLEKIEEIKEITRKNKEINAYTNNPNGKNNIQSQNSEKKITKLLPPIPQDKPEEEKIIIKRRNVVNHKTSIWKEGEENKNSIFVEQNNQDSKSKKGDSKFSKKPLDENEQRLPESENNLLKAENDELKEKIQIVITENEKLKRKIENFNQDKQNNKDLENRLKNCEKSLSDFHKLKLILLQKFSIFKD